MFSPQQLLDHINSRKADYNRIRCHPSFICHIKEESFDLNFFVPVKERVEFFRPFIEYAKRSAENSPYKVRFVFIENDVSPKYSELCAAEKIDYIFIPSEVSLSEGIFAKALAYNMGFICTPRVLWSVYHDLDILIDNNYFRDLKTYLEKNVSWLQPYTGKRVILLGSDISNSIIKSAGNGSLIDLNSAQDKKPSNVGCPGGSIVVKAEDFINIGGYDPELFFGYSPEDSFFWSKLEVLHGAKKCPFSTHFQGNGVYADDPKIDVYHLYHPSVQNNNPYYPKMLEVLDSFYKFSNKDRLELIELKKQIFREALQ